MEPNLVEDPGTRTAARRRRLPCRGWARHHRRLEPWTADGRGPRLPGRRPSCAWPTREAQRRRDPRAGWPHASLEAAGEGGAAGPRPGTGRGGGQGGAAAAGGEGEAGSGRRRCRCAWRGEPPPRVGRVCRGEPPPRAGRTCSLHRRRGMGLGPATGGHGAGRDGGQGREPEGGRRVLGCSPRVGLRAVAGGGRGREARGQGGDGAPPCRGRGRGLGLGPRAEWRRRWRTGGRRWRGWWDAALREWRRREHGAGG